MLWTLVILLVLVVFVAATYSRPVRDLNIRIAQFPTNLVASLFNFRPHEFFEMAAGERESPHVEFKAPGA